MKASAVREIADTLPEPARSRLIERADVLAWLEARGGLEQIRNAISQGAHIGASEEAVRRKYERGGPGDR